MWQKQERQGEEEPKLEGKWGLGRDLQIPYHQFITPSIHQFIIIIIIILPFA